MKAASIPGASAQANATPHAHLTEAQLDDLLIGDLAAAAVEHLAICEHCTARAAQAAAPLKSFRTVSLAWGERQSAVTPIPQAATASGPWQRSLIWSLAGTMAFAACAAGLGLANADRQAAAMSAEPSETAYIQTPSADQLTDDNQLLNTIDHETGAPSENLTTLGFSVSAPRAAVAPAALFQASVQD